MPARMYVYMHICMYFCMSVCVGVCVFVLETINVFYGYIVSYSYV